MEKGIRKYWLVRYLISLLHCIESKIAPILIDDEIAVRRYYKKLTGNEIDLENPTTFSEKINWYKLHDRNPLMIQCADKIGVRDYIISKGLGSHLNEVYQIYQNVDEIDISTLPKSFVLKAAHGSHMNLIVKDKGKVNWKLEKKMMRTWLRQDIAWSGREWPYKEMPKRILAERYLEDENGELRDYKFFCFHGEPEYMEYDIGRFTNHQRRNYYDMGLNHLKFSDGIEWMEIDQPISNNNFEAMKSMARTLSSEFQQVRVDFYMVHDKIYIGEMTFFDGGGGTIFYPDEWNVLFSEKWHIR